MSFYKRIFGWRYEQISQPDGSDYLLASTGDAETAALFEMPQKFRDIGLPSFWMPYFLVEDAEAACKLAAKMGGKIEVPATDWGNSDKIALIRDPLGAGFTIYQGTDLASNPAPFAHGQRSSCALYVSDRFAVLDFYQRLFRWKFDTDPQFDGSYLVRGADGAVSTRIYELDDVRRGKFQFWGVTISVSDLPDALNEIERQGGEVIEADTGQYDSSALVKDINGAAIFLSALGSNKTAASHQSVSGLRKSKWKTILALPLLAIAVLFEQNWLWGLLFLTWTLPALKSGQTFFVESIKREANPVLYWLILSTWIALSIYLIATDLLMIGQS